MRRRVVLLANAIAGFLFGIGVTATIAGWFVGPLNAPDIRVPAALAIIVGAAILACDVMGSRRSCGRARSKDGAR